MRNLIRLSSILFLVMSSFFVQQAHALKVNTHVWVAEEIIKDLEDGKLTIYVNGSPVEIQVNSQVKSYILNHRKEFRAGSLGPDAFPDVAVGQISIHPGAKNRGVSGKTWNTDDWLKYILQSAKHAPEKAFAYGNLVHAASDVIAHSYVNMYAGDIFDVVEHVNVDTEPDRRHFLLESYIGELTPNLGNNLSYKDAVAFPDTRKYLQDLYQSIYIECMIEQRRENINMNCHDWAERRTSGDDNDFLLRTFIYNPKDIKSLVTTYGSSSGIKYPTQIAQYNDAAGESVLGGVHLSAIYNLRYKIEQMIQSNALKEMDIAITQAVVFYWTDIQLSDGQAEVLNDLHQDIKKLEYRSVEQLQAIKNKLEDIVNNSTLKVHGATESVARLVDSHNQALARTQSKIFDLENKVLDLDSRIKRASCPWWDPICNAILDLEDKLKDAKRDLDREVTNYVANRNLLLNAVKQLHETLQGIELVRRSLDDAAIDLAQVFMKDVNPVRAILINWAEGIDAAMLSYRTVGMQMMQEAMIGRSPVTPLKQWAFTECNLAKLIGIGNEFGTSACKLNRNAQALLDEIEQLKPFLSGVLLGNVKTDITELLKNKVKQELKRHIVNELMDKVDPELIEFLEIMRANVDGARLNAEFRSGGSQGYLNIPDMSDRVKAEMRVVYSSSVCKGKAACFSKEKFPLIFNAVQLSKIALLGKTELQSLASKTGYTVDLLNDNGYSNGNGFDTSLLINSIKSIDGNHQWYGKMSPPLPRDKSHPQNYVWHQNHYGYSNGKILGDDNTAKQNIMYSLFIGPLNEGLFTPKALGFAGESLLSNTYRQKFDECKGHIFQLGVSDNYCNSVEDIYDPDGGSSTNPPPPPPPPWDEPCGRGTGVICR